MRLIPSAWARCDMTSVLHTWGSLVTHYPYVHMIVPGGGLSSDSPKGAACNPRIFLPVRVLSRLCRRLFVYGLLALHRAEKLVFFYDMIRFAWSKSLLTIKAVIESLPISCGRGRSPYRRRSAKCAHIILRG